MFKTLLASLLALGCGLLGVICLRSPLAVTRVIFKWAGFWLWIGNTPLPEEGQQARFLIEHDPAQFETRYGGVLARIRLMGAIALVMAVAIPCMAIFGGP